MRTTVSLDDSLLAAAKRVALQRGQTLGRVIEDALRRDLYRAVPAAAPEIPVFRGGSGPAPGLDLTSTRALTDFLDEGIPLDQRR